MINCPDCGKNVSARAKACPNCGCPIAGADEVKINFPVWQGQMAMNKCFVHDSSGNELASCRAGETVTFKISSPTKITVKVGGAFGKPTQVVNPGENFKVEYRAFGKIHLVKVDSIV